jgi:RNA polymerase-interacting CarD/CdnL/TRCF family regulator
MQFNVGDFIVHPTHGVGEIVKIEEKRFTGKETSLYYNITLPNRTLWVPVESEIAAELRPVTARSELGQYRKLLKSPPTPLDTNYQKRHLELVRRLNEGSFRALCEVVRDLTARGWRKPLGQQDTATLKKTRENLVEEWATSAGISRAEAIQEVEALLQTTQQAFES